MRRQVHGQAIALPFVTEIDLDGKYYVVFKSPSPSLPASSPLRPRARALRSDETRGRQRSAMGCAVLCRARPRLG